MDLKIYGFKLLLVLFLSEKQSMIIMHNNLTNNRFPLKFIININYKSYK